MGVFAVYFMMHQLTELSSKGAKPSIQPLIDYLRAGQPLDDRFRKFRGCRRRHVRGLVWGRAFGVGSRG